MTQRLRSSVTPEEFVAAVLAVIEAKEYLASPERAVGNPKVAALFEDVPAPVAPRPETEDPSDPGHDFQAAEVRLAEMVATAFGYEQAWQAQGRWFVERPHPTEAGKIQVADVEKLLSAVPREGPGAAEPVAPGEPVDWNPDSDWDDCPLCNRPQVRCVCGVPKLAAESMDAMALEIRRLSRMLSRVAALPSGDTREEEVPDQGTMSLEREKYIRAEIMRLQRQDHEARVISAVRRLAIADALSALLTEIATLNRELSTLRAQVAAGEGDRERHKEIEKMVVALINDYRLVSADAAVVDFRKLQAIGVMMFQDAARSPVPPEAPQ